MSRSPAPHGPARLAGLSENLSRAPAPAGVPVRVCICVILVVFVAGIVLGLTADAWAALPSHSDFQPSTLSSQLNSHE